MANTVQDELAEKLSPILKKDIVIRNSHLLRAHAMFVALGEHSGEELIKLYLELVASDRYKHAIMGLSRRASPRGIEEAGRAFRRYSTEKFLRFIVPELVANVPEIVSLWKSELCSDILLLTDVIIGLRKLMYPDSKKGTEVDEPITREDAVLPSNPTMVRLYRQYCRQESDSTFLLTQKQFERFYRCINLYPISSEELYIKPIGYKKEDLDQLVIISKNQLELSVEQQYELCFRFFVENKQAEYYVGQERLYRFFKIKDGTERKMCLKIQMQWK